MKINNLILTKATQKIYNKRYKKSALALKKQFKELISKNIKKIV